MLKSDIEQNKSNQTSRNLKLIGKLFNFFFQTFNLSIPFSSLQCIFEILKFGSFGFLTNFWSDLSSLVQETHNLNKIFLNTSSCSHCGTSDSDTWWN